MSNEAEAGTRAFDSSSETIELRLRHKPNHRWTLKGHEASADELTLTLVHEWINQATDPIPQANLRIICSFGGSN